MIVICDTNISQFSRRIPIDSPLCFFYTETNNYFLRKVIIMATIVERAAAGQRKAMQHLYQTNKSVSFRIAGYLLSNEKAAADTVFAVFSTIWKELSSSGDTSEAGFSRLVIQKTVESCKKKLSARDSKAFRVPAGKDFSLQTAIRSYEEDEDPLHYVLSHFTILQRFLFILRTVCGYSNVALSRALQLDSKLVTAALEAEKQNITLLLNHISGESISSSEELCSLAASGRLPEVPDDTEHAVNAVIEKLAAPGEQKKRRLITISSIAAIAVCLCVAGVFLYQLLQTRFQQAGSPKLDPSLTYYADIEIADYGTITFRLEQDDAPITTANFVSLAESGFYDGLTFHRIMEGFMMQGGDPNGNGSGGSGQKIVGEFTENGYDNPLSHTRGAVSMARANDPNSASSQFFIVHQDNQRSLDGKYAVFGYVTEGMDVVDLICESAQPTDNNGTIPAAAQPVITRITIRTE